jgi:uncharacterized repeat protein (TIGR01451 family)
MRRTAGIAVCLLVAAVAVALIGGSGSAGAAVGDTDISLIKADTADPVTVGDTFGYVITLKNEGTNDAADVKVADTLSSLITYVSATSSSDNACTKSGSTLNCDLGPMNAGAAASVTIMVKASSSGTATDTASLTSANDTNPANNLDSESTTINKAPTTPKAPKAPKQKHKGRASCASPTMVGTPGDDVLQGTGRADAIVGLTGNDQIYSGGGNDVICSDGGVDLVDGGPGKDFINGGGGPDRLIGEDGGDTLKGKSGRDRLAGGQGNDILGGGKGLDKCNGGPGNNTLLRCP